MSAPTTPSNRRTRFSNARHDFERARESATPEPGLNTPPPSARKVQHVATSLAENRNLHHAHPSTILSRLLKDISNPNSRHYARYGEYITAEGQNLVDLLHRCIRQEVWDLLDEYETTHHPSISELASTGGDTSFYGRAIYLHIVKFPKNITRLYVGQAFNLAARIRNQHSDWRYRRDHPSLHNFAMDRSTDDQYVVLAVIREACERSDLVLNLLEMWIALWLGTLPDEVMEAWLGQRPECEDEESDEDQVLGLNVAEPLDQGDSEAWKPAFNMLKDSGDEMTKEYYWNVRKRPRPVVTKLKDAVMPQVVAERAWLAYVPHALSVLAFGFVLGRWSTRWTWRR